MFNTKNHIEQELLLHQALQDKYTQKMKNLPGGGLSSMVRNNRTYYYHVYGGKRKYLGNGYNHQVQLLQKRYFLEKSLLQIEKNIKAMNSFLQQYKSIDPNQMIKSFPRAYQSLPYQCFNIAGAIDIDKWGSARYYKNSKYPEDLTQKTTGGDTVRSKSEVVIANLLSANGIKYRYEHVFTLNDGTEIAPDFEIFVKSEHRKKYWEHFGLMNNPKYLQNCQWKIAKYIENGLFPCQNLIITYDDVDGNIDASQIQKIIDTFLR